MNKSIETGDIRHLLAESMFAVRNGKLSVDKATGIAALAKELNNNMAVEIKLHQVNSQLMSEGRKMAELTHFGRAVIADAPHLPTEIEHKPEFEPQEK